MAKPLVLAGVIGACAIGGARTALQKLHSWAASGFCFPHFGQYILRSPFELIFVHFKSPRTIFSPL
jgi:hypothetical protein